jgi:glutaredoxin
MSAVELYGTTTCPCTTELREPLEWSGVAFSEFDVDADPAARVRMLALTSGRRTVPVLVRDGRVAEIGWRGRGCIIDPDGTGS